MPVTLQRCKDYSGGSIQSSQHIAITTVTPRLRRYIQRRTAWHDLHSRGWFNSIIQVQILLVLLSSITACLGRVAGVGGTGVVGTWEAVVWLYAVVGCLRMSGFLSDTADCCRWPRDEHLISLGLRLLGRWLFVIGRLEWSGWGR